VVDNSIAEDLHTLDREFEKSSKQRDKSMTRDSDIYGDDSFEDADADDYGDDSFEDGDETMSRSSPRRSPRIKPEVADDGGLVGFSLGGEEERPPVLDSVSSRNEEIKTAAEAEAVRRFSTLFAFDDDAREKEKPQSSQKELAAPPRSTGGTLLASRNGGNEAQGNIMQFSSFFDTNLQQAQGVPKVDSNPPPRSTGGTLLASRNGGNEAQGNIMQFSSFFDADVSPVKSRKQAAVEDHHLEDNHVVPRVRTRTPSHEESLPAIPLPMEMTSDTIYNEMKELRSEMKQLRDMLQSQMGHGQAGISPIVQEVTPPALPHPHVSEPREDGPETTASSPGDVPVDEHAIEDRLQTLVSIHFLN
jgi:hypothetical protein